MQSSPYLDDIVDMTTSTGTIERNGIKCFVLMNGCNENKKLIIEIFKCLNVLTYEVG